MSKEKEQLHHQHHLGDPGDPPIMKKYQEDEGPDGETIRDEIPKERALMTSVLDEAKQLTAVQEKAWHIDAVQRQLRYLNELKDRVKEQQLKLDEITRLSNRQYCKLYPMPEVSRSTVAESIRSSIDYNTLYRNALLNRNAIITTTPTLV